jgi:hypothetical protein
MTLPASGPISMSQVASELGLSASGINLNHAWVRQLAGANSGAVSMNSLLEQTATFSGNYTPGQSGGNTFFTPGAPFFRGTISQVLQNVGGGGTFNVSLTSSGVNWTGNIKLTGYNGNSAILTPQGGGSWAVTGHSSPLLQNGINTTFTFQPN